MGVYFALLSVGGILATPFNGAISPFLINEIAAKTPDNLGRIKGLVLVSLSGALVYIACVHTAAPFILSKLGGNMVDWSAFIPLIVLSLSLTAITSASLLGYGKLSLSQFPDNVVRPVILIVLLFSLARSSELQVDSALGAVVLAQIVAVAFAFLFVSFKSKMSATPPSNPMRVGIFRSYLQHLMNAAAAALQAQLPVLIVSAVALSHAAYFSLAQKVVGLLAVAGSLIGISNSKRYADLAAAGATGEASRYFKSMLGSTLFIIMPLIVAWLAFGDRLITAAFGSRYVAEVSGIVLLLLPAYLAFSIVGPLLTYLYGMQKQMSVLYLQLASTALLVAVGSVMTQRFGARGMAVSVSLSQVLLYCGVFLLFRRIVRN